MKFNSHCHQETNMHEDLQTCVVQCHNLHCTSSECMKQIFKHQDSGRKCVHFGGDVSRVTRFDVVPKILLLSIQDSSVSVSKRPSIHSGEKMVVFSLKGVVYFGDFHYTSCICVNKHVWLNNGMLTGQKSTYKKPLVEFSGTDLSICSDKTASLIVYAQT
jgi:hypothetical protein